MPCSPKTYRIIKQFLSVVSDDEQKVDISWITAHNSIDKEDSEWIEYMYGDMQWYQQLYIMRLDVEHYEHCRGCQLGLADCT